MAHLLLNPIFLGLAAYTDQEIEDLVRNFPINLNFNRHHVIDKIDHDFNDVCGEDCITLLQKK